MPGTNEPLHSCVACYREVDGDEFDELRRETDRRRGCITNNGGGLLSSYLFGWRRHDDMSNAFVTLAEYGECILWESDAENSCTLDGVGDGKDNRNLDESAPQLLDTSFDANNSQRRAEELERERIVSFYNRLNDGTTPKQAAGGFANNNGSSHHEIYLNDAGERIVGCLIGTFLSSSRPSSKQQQQESTSERDETAALLIPEPDKYRRMFYIMTLGTVPEFRRFGLGSILVNRVVDMIETRPECGALYLHVITYNKGGERHYIMLTWCFQNMIRQ